MKIQIPAGGYIFNAAAKTITFLGLIPASLDRIRQVTNVTRGRLYFQPQAGAAFSGSYASPVLTLAADTTGHANGDSLLILVDDGFDIAKGAGTVDAETQRMVLAADDPASVALALIEDKLPDLEDGRVPVQTVALPAPFVRVGFSEVGSGVVGNASEFFTLLQTGAGMAVNQSGGNLVITSGTTALAETLLMSNFEVSGSLMMRWKALLSQRIANQFFRFELADLVGQGLPFVINSATSVTVTFPGNNPFTALNVGQSMRMGAIAGAAGVPGRYAIASVSGQSVTFTVAGWPATGLGTLMLYGWNSIFADYQGTSATSVNFDAARRGWASGVTGVTINTTAAPGHVGQFAYDVATCGFGDSSPASNGSYQFVGRASRIENIPDPEIPLRIFIAALNGATPPASSTTLTIGFVQIEDQGRQKVRVASSDPSPQHAIPANLVVGIPAGSNAIGDVGIQVRANSTGAATVLPCQSPATPAIGTLKGSAGRLLAYSLTNNAAAVRYVKLYNATAPNLGVTNALIEIAIPPNSSIQNSIPAGLAFSSAIVHTVTSARGLNDNTATGLQVGDVVGWFAFA